MIASTIILLKYGKSLFDLLFLLNPRLGFSRATGMAAIRVPTIRELYLLKKYRSHLWALLSTCPPHDQQQDYQCRNPWGHCCHCPAGGDQRWGWRRQPEHKAEISTFPDQDSLLNKDWPGWAVGVKLNCIPGREEGNFQQHFTHFYFFSLKCHWVSGA